MNKKSGKIIQVKISLLGSDPEIFRRVLVYDDITLDVMHDVIQLAMGWNDTHLHQFIKDKVFYSMKQDDNFGFNGYYDTPEDEDESKYTVGKLLPRVRSRMQYEYDFGDLWRHEIRREKLTKEITELNSPLCIEGQYACPSEDCGGLWGYDDYLEIAADPKKHPEYKELLEWWGDFDPEYFNLDEVNEQLCAIKIQPEFAR